VNSLLQSAFEEQLEANVDGDGDILIGGTTFSPIEVLKSDAAAYQSEFQAWRDDVWLPEQLETLEQILPLHANHRRFEELCAATERNCVAPLVGSGMSVPTGFPIWSDFLRSVREFSKLSAVELEKLLAESAFEEGVDRLTATMNPRLFDERIEHNLRVYDANDICGAVCFLPELFPQTVLTTNLDDLLEHLYFGAGRTFAHVLEGSRIVEYRKLRAESESVLLKLHGDCRNRNNRVLGTAEYVSAYGPGGTIREELTLVYRTRTVLCLGCSLGSDRTVRLLREVAESDTNMPKHYAFLQMPEPEAKRLEREHFLTERDIFPIWYQDDHDKSIRALLVGLLRQLGKF